MSILKHLLYNLWAIMSLIAWRIQLDYDDNLTRSVELICMSKKNVIQLTVMLIFPVSFVLFELQV